jgi:2-polyprenyl-3-methyl-5-hydroxy-6-metoxy-1,4-benzoquinol methylase
LDLSQATVASAAVAQSRVEDDLPQPLSVTHRHLLSCVNSALSEYITSPNTVRILDVGCGDGLLIRYFVQSLSALHPGRKIEVHGMDVHDHGVQPAGYWAHTLGMLSGAVPGVDWQDRLRLISISDSWPYADGFFDIVVSNQVLEHVGDHRRFFHEHRRVLSRDGVGFHLFPTHHCILEPHLRLPLVHWISDREWRKSAIAMTTRLGFGKFSGTAQERDAYASTHADYLRDQVNYKTQRQLAEVAEAEGLAPSFALTHRYDVQKLRTMAGRPFEESYASSDSMTGKVLAMILRYVSSVTLQVRPQRRTDI